MSHLVKLIIVKELLVKFDDEESAREWAEKAEKEREDVSINECKVLWGKEVLSELEILKTTPVRHVFLGDPGE